MAEEKVKFLMRIDPDTDRKIKAAMPGSNCRSQNEFVEKALQFYCSYLAAQDTTRFLPPIFLEAMRGTLQSSEEHISRLLFKLAVEMSMMMNVLAIGLEIDASQMDRLRGQCVQAVKKSNGSISFKGTVQERQT